MKNIIIAIFTIGVIVSSCGGDKEKKYASKPVIKEQTKESLNSNKEEASSNVAKATDISKSSGQELTVSKEQLEKANIIIKGVSDADISAVDSPAKFKMLCASCHGFKGNMMVNGAKDLTKSKISLEESVAQVYFGKGLMTPFKGVMTEAEIVAVAKYIEKEFMK